MLTQRALRILALAAAVAFLPPGPLTATPASPGAQELQRPQQDQPGAASLVTVQTRDTSGNPLRSGPGVFLEIGRLIVPRELLLDRAYSAVVVYGGREQRVTAVIGDDPQAGLVLVAVDLPDGAPPPIRLRRSLAPHEALCALTPDRERIPVDVSPPREVAGIGAMCPVTVHGRAPESGTPVVDARGEMAGLFLQRSAGDVRLAFLLPTARVVRVPAIAPVTIAEWLRRPREARSQDAEAAYLRGARALLDGRPEQAATSFEEARTAGADDPDLHAALAASHLAAGRPEGAITAYRAAIAARPADPRLHHELAVVLGDAGRWQEAVQEFAEVTRLRPGDPDAFFNLGSAYGKLGRGQDEYSAYEVALAANPAHVQALRNMGIVCIALKRYAEAVAFSSRAVRLLPSDAALRAQLGVAYFDSGRHGLAIEELKKAIELEPGFVKAHYGLALVYAAAGQQEAAIREAETLKQLAPDRGAEVMKFVTRQR